MTGAAHHDTEAVAVADNVRAALFAEMVKLAGPIEHFHSDLFHNIRWIAAKVHGPMTFYWAPHTWGSDIGAERGPVATPKPGKKLYRVQLVREHGCWSARFTAEGPSAP